MIENLARFLITLFLASTCNSIQAQTTSNVYLNMCLMDYCDQDTITKQELIKSHKLTCVSNGILIFQFTYFLQCVGGDGYSKTVKADSLGAIDISLIGGVNNRILFGDILAKNRYGQLVRLNSREYYIRTEIFKK